MPQQLSVDPSDVIIIGVDRDPTGDIEKARVDNRSLEFGANPGDEELIHSVFLHGVKQPVACREKSKGEAVEVIDGVRRTLALRAANNLRESTGDEPWLLPIIVDRYDDLESLRTKISLNCHRAEDDPISLGLMFKVVLDSFQSAGAKYPDAVKKLSLDANCSDSKVRQYVQFLDLSPDVQDQVRKGSLGIAAAVSLRNLAPQTQSKAAEKLISSGKGKDAQAARAVRDEVEPKEGIPKIPMSTWADVFTLVELEKNHPDMRPFLPLVKAIQVALGKLPLGDSEISILVERVSKLEKK